MLNTTAIFDIGKTNKKVLLFDDSLNLVHEIQSNFDEIEDEDGEPCEDLKLLTDWMLGTWKSLESDNRFDIKALNFTTYGASFVHLDENHKPITPLYNYLKKFPIDIEQQLYKTYGEALDIATDTASPKLGMLNSGFQLYWLKYKHPILFKKIKVSLHLPQYCAWLFCKQLTSEFTSIGCHTALWDLAKNEYHHWVKAEGIDVLFPTISKNPVLGTTQFRGRDISVGTGLHDSSSALIPYLKKFKEDFILLSTGTWCIALNPFAQQNLTKTELLNDCLNFLTFAGSKVKASRLFLGNEHEVITKRLAAHFFKDKDAYKATEYNTDLETKALSKPLLIKDYYSNPSNQTNPNLDLFETYEEAYHKLIWDVVELQYKSLLLAAENNLANKTIFVDGGFSKNQLFMKMLQNKIQNSKVKAFELSQGTALGAVMMMQ